jgi:uncharacterized protein (DUF58 family)
MLFTKRFFVLLAIGVVVLFLSVRWPGLRWVVVGYDLWLFAAVFFDFRSAGVIGDLHVARHLPSRFQIGIENEVSISLESRLARRVAFSVKDDYPSQLELRGQRPLTLDSGLMPARASYKLFATTRGDYRFGDLWIRWSSPLGLITRQARVPAAENIKVYPNLKEAKRHELLARRNRDLLAGLRRTPARGQGREFESLRDYVQGDEMRHIAWTATARRGRMITRQYQVERNQSIVVLLDAGRLMTSRLGQLTKLDHAINATLSMAYVALRGEDNIGLVIFARQVESYLPPKRGHGQMQAFFEALYNVRAQMIEPSYSRAFQYFSRECKRRSLVIILTDLVDRDASAELLGNTTALMPRHLPLIVTIGDNDLRSLVAEVPKNVTEVYRQSVAEELLQQREEALARITDAGGLALDVPAGQLSFHLVNKYLEVKERGLL